MQYTFSNSEIISINGLFDATEDLIATAKELIQLVENYEQSDDNHTNLLTLRVRICAQQRNYEFYRNPTEKFLKKIKEMNDELRRQDT
jgi:hypothetical protein